MATVKLSDNVSPVFVGYHKNISLHNLTEGGRAGFKSSTNAIELALIMLQPNTDIIVLRENYSDHKDSTYNELITAFKRLGIELTQGKHYPFGHNLWIKLPNGSRARFYGNISKNYENIKGKTPTPGNTIRALWYFEITQFESNYCIQQVNSSFLRGKKDRFHTFQEWNPPQQKSHWVYEYRDKMRKRDDVNYIFVNYNYHPIELQRQWIGEIALREIEALKLIDDEQYRHIYLGESIALGGRIYKRFNRSQFTFDGEINKAEFINHIQVGIDIGYSDKFVVNCSFIGLGYERMVVQESLVIDNKKRELHSTITGVIKGNEYDPVQCVEQTMSFLQAVVSKYKMPVVGYVDSADKGIQMMFKTYIATHGISNIIIKAVNKTKRFEKSESAIEERIMFGNILIGADALRINKKCKHLIEAFEDACRDKNGVRKDDATTDWNDSLDAFEYSIMNYLKAMQIKILQKQGRMLNDI